MFRVDNINESVIWTFKSLLPLKIHNRVKMRVRIIKVLIIFSTLCQSGICCTDEDHNPNVEVPVIKYPCDFGKGFCNNYESVTEFYDGCRPCICFDGKKNCEGDENSCEFLRRSNCLNETDVITFAQLNGLSGYCKRVELHAKECSDYPYRFLSCIDYED